MTDYVETTVQDAARRAIEQAEVLRSFLPDQECFAQVLSPPRASTMLLPDLCSQWVFILGWHVSSDDGVTLGIEGGAHPGLPAEGAAGSTTRMPCRRFSNSSGC